MAKRKKDARWRIIKRIFHLNDKHLNWVICMDVSQATLESWRRQATHEGIGLPHFIERQMAAWRRNRARAEGKPVMVRLGVKIHETLHRRVSAGCAKRGIKLDVLISDILNAEFPEDEEAA